MLTDSKEKLLKEFVERLKFAAGDNLKSVVLYGSGADDEPGVANQDMNVLCVLDDTHAASLRKLSTDIQWWTTRKQPRPMIFTADEIRRSADVFAIEFSDIKYRHRVLYGVDYIDDLEVPMNLHRVQVERELRVNYIRLREEYLSVAFDETKLMDLMTASISSFVTLFRHALIALGDEAPHKKEAVIDAAARKFGFDSAPFRTILAWKSGAKMKQEPDAARLFAAYLDGVAQVTEDVDSHLT